MINLQILFLKLLIVYTYKNTSSSLLPIQYNQIIHHYKQHLYQHEDLEQKLRRVMVSMKQIQIVNSPNIDYIGYETDKLRNHPRSRIEHRRYQSKRYKQPRMLSHRL